MRPEKDVSILSINILFFLMAILLITLGTLVQSLDIKVGLLVTELLLVLLPSIVFLRSKGVAVSKYLRLNKMKLKHGLLVVFITILSYPVALFFNLVVLTFLSSFGKIQQPPIPTASNFTEYIVLMVIISMSAGVCEEVFFRGVLMRGYERFGIVSAIATSSILFGMFHFNLQNFAGPTILGIIFGYLVYRTNSLYAGIIGHATNNGIAVTIGYLANQASNKLAQRNIPQIQELPNTFQLAASLVFVGVIAIITGLCAFALIRIIVKETKIEVYTDRGETGIEENKKTSLGAFVPIFCTVAIFLVLAYLQLRQIINPIS